MLLMGASAVFFKNIKLLNHPDALKYVEGKINGLQGVFDATKCNILLRHSIFSSILAHKSSEELASIRLCSKSVLIKSPAIHFF